MEPIQFGNYTLLERVSHGGMAEVFRAKCFGEAGFEREVALKVLLPSMESDQEFVNMLIDEAKIAGQLNHANIAQIFDLGVTDQRYYIVQEYVKGQALRAILKYKLENKTHLDISKACYIALKVCEGLHYAHNKEDPSGKPLKLVHRDISPHNILISDEGEVKIIDFGIAKAEGRATKTMAGLVKGKFAYMSPEQVRGLPVDHRSDVFATGILLHEMLSTKPLFRRASEFETLKRARSAMADPPSQFNPRVPPALDRIVLKALARHVDDRYQSAQDLRDALWSFAREHNAFDTSNDGDSALSPNSQGGAGTESGIEIEIASEVSAINEFVGRGDRLIATDVENGYEISVEGSEDTESATMVDPKLPFGIPGLARKEEVIDERTAQDDTPTGHGAQWATRHLTDIDSDASATIQHSPLVDSDAAATFRHGAFAAPDPASPLPHTSFDEQTVRKPGPKSGPTRSPPATVTNPVEQNPMQTHMGVEAPSNEAPPYAQPSGAGSAPLPMPPSAAPQSFAQPGMASYSQSSDTLPYAQPPPPIVHGVRTDNPSPSPRLYMLMVALFVLLLAGAATITLIITD